MRQGTALPIDFRPHPGLRGLAVGVGLLCAAAAVGSLLQYREHGETARLVGAFLFLLPILLAAFVLRRRIRLEAAGVQVTGALRRQVIAWEDVLAIEQTRRSFIIVTSAGDISAGWIAPSSRDLLFRKVLELARLTLEPKQQRWGVIARYVRGQTAGVVRAADVIRVAARPARPEE